jgi:hypothetical protein
MARERISDAMDHVETLLTPPQMAIPADLEAQMRAAVDAWNANEQTKANVHLKKTADRAREIGYL